MAIPSLRKILPFPATENHTIYFDVSGISQQIFYNELEIKLSSDTSQVVYLQRVQEFRYQHTIPTNTLTNGNQYVAVTRIYDSTNTLIGESNPIFFYCLSYPILDIPTIVNGEVGNQTVMFQGIYEQAEGELLESYQFVLYNDNRNIITQSPIIYSDNMQYEFTELESRQKYYIELKISTVNGIVATTGLMEFTPRYVAPRFNSAIELKNLFDEASLFVKCNVIRIIGISDIESIEFIDDNEIDLINNGIWFDEGFKLRGNFTIQMWLRDIADNSTFFKLIARDGSYLRLEYKKNKINLYKMLNDEYVMQRLLGDTEIDIANKSVFICIKHIDGFYDFKYEMVVS